MAKILQFVVSYIVFVGLVIGMAESKMGKPRVPIEFDTVIRNVRLIDGTGTPWFRTDVGIIGDSIEAVGKIDQESLDITKTIVEGEGMYLAPGFIDSHTHDDVAVFKDPAHVSKTLQGITTVVTGSCSFSSYPNGENTEIQNHLSSLLGDVSPNHFFKDFTGFATSLQQSGMGLNIASLVGHGPIRISVMGYEHREANSTEIETMCTLLETQLEQGAIGLSLGLVYPPSAYAGLDELVSLGKVVAKYDRVISAHIRSYEGNLLTSIQEFLAVLEGSGAKGLLSHLQVAGVPYWGSLMPQAIEMIESARSSGIDINVDMYPYTAGSSSILQLLPPSAMSGGFEALEEKLLNDPEYYAELQLVTESGTEPGWESKIALIGWENVVINSVVNPELTEYGIEGLNIREGMLKLGYETEFSFCVMVILMDKGRSNIIMFQQSEDDLNMVFQSRLHMVGSDSIPREGGKPHPRMYGSFPRVMGKMAQTQNVFHLEEAVRKSTSMTAARFGIFNRGIIRPGMIADLVLFTEGITDQASYEEPTLNPTGVMGVWVNGVRVVNNGEAIAALPGKVIV